MKCYLKYFLESLRENYRTFIYMTPFTPLKKRSSCTFIESERSKILLFQLHCDSIKDHQLFFTV